MDAVVSAHIFFRDFFFHGWRNSGFETRSPRLKLAASKIPHLAVTLTRGVSVLYRRNEKNGTWIVRVLAADRKIYWTKRIGDADDFTKADDDTIQTFDRAKELARGGDTEAAPAAAPITVETASAF